MKESDYMTFRGLLDDDLLDSSSVKKTCSKHTQCYALALFTNAASTVTLTLIWDNQQYSYSKSLYDIWQVTKWNHPNLFEVLDINLDFTICQIQTENIQGDCSEDLFSDSSRDDEEVDFTETTTGRILGLTYAELKPCELADIAQSSKKKKG
eukprot:7380348-Ditylum_brightwellii.AAC.1